MIRTKNLSPFLFGYRVCSRRPPQPEMTCIVRGKFDLAPGQPLVPSREKLSPIEVDEEDRTPQGDALMEEAECQLGQGKLNADVFEEGDDYRTGQLLYPSDFAEFKLNAEIMVLGSCHPSRQTTEATVRVELGDWHKELVVTGARVWVDHLAGGKHSEPVAFSSMPLDWRHAYGGPEYADNPVGKGHGSDELPNVEHPRHRVTRSGQRVPPAGLGPVNPEWPHRKAKLGKSYGEEYERKYEPWYPADFDWTNLHAAPADQQLKGYLEGGERLRFVNLHPGSTDFTVEVPRCRPRVFVRLADGKQTEVKLTIDTILADLSPDEDGKTALYVTWRGLTAVREDDLGDVVCALVVNEEADSMPLGPKEYLAQLERYHDDPLGLDDTKLGSVKELHDKIESGAIQAEIDAVPEDDDTLANILDKILAPLLDEPHMGQLRQQAQDAMKSNQGKPDAPRLIKLEVKKALDQALDPMGPGMGIGPDGQMKGGAAPMITRTLGHVAKAQKEAIDRGDVDMSEIDQKIEEALANISDEGLRAELSAVKMAELRERQDAEPAPEADLRGADLSGRDLRGLDLHGINLEGAILTRANLSGCNLDGAKMMAAVLSSADLSGARCRGADLTLAMMSRTSCVGTDFEGSTMDQAALLRADLTEANLQGVSGTTIQGSHATFDRVRAEGANFELATFDNCSFAGADLTGLRLRRTMFRQCNLVGVVFDRATIDWCGFLESDLSGSRFFQTTGKLTSWQGATMSEADFSFATLPENMFMNVAARRAKFRCADMPEVRFYKAILREADFEKANMFSADMRKTSLSNARFNGANLYQARFIEAFGTDADFSDANIDKANFKRNRLVSRGA